MAPSTACLNFALLFTRSGNQYRVCVVDVPGDDADIIFSLPLKSEDLTVLQHLSDVRRDVRSPRNATGKNQYLGMGELDVRIIRLREKRLQDANIAPRLTRADVLNHSADQLENVLFHRLTLLFMINLRSYSHNPMP